MLYPELDDIQLLRLLQEKNEDALAEIYNRYWKLLYKSAYAIVQDEAISKDAVQEVFIALWQRNLPEDIQFLKAYLHQAVRFQILKAIKAQKTDEHFYERLATVTSDIFYDNPMLFKEQEALLKDILHSLPEDCRQIFVMSREEQLTYKQIAAQLHISEKTVEKKMSICLKQIRQILEHNRALLAAFVVFLTSNR